MIKKEKGALQYVFTRDVFARNLLMALIVGSVLSVANQLDVVLTQPLTSRLVMKLVFNFLIPFAVSSVSAALNRKC